MQIVDIQRGDSPLILAMPHAGVLVPEDIFARLSPLGQKLGDTDWHVDKLYQGLAPNATSLRANFHRYVIDANRDPSGASLYPGQNTTELCPLRDFDNQPLYREGCEPDEAEIQERLGRYHSVYHQALAAEVSRVQQQHGVAVLYDCHSIRAEVPHLFDGRLPDFNIGSDGGRTCGAAFEMAVVRACQQAQGYSNVLNGRFRGGWTTRHYGRPQAGIHAIQMELAQRSYLDESAPEHYRPALAAPLRQHLGKILEGLEAIARLQADKPA